MADFRTPLGRVYGLGSAKDGTGHFIRQRVSAVAMAVLAIWFVVAMIGLAGAGHAEATAWLARPVNAIPMLLLVIAAFYHARLGLQVVIEDYVHGEAAKMSLLMLVTFATFGLGVACVFSILKVALGA
ncbi:MAG: succinate dehydrogenase, hydrophobic membrane anchor protein [Alphaproteobacteria bacterium]|nr:succinate dehydrogenase, hydrophobic membrane anchor protein [Alphaproteobacteria bacterium]MDX5369719.1 succinate dehydrogenase, hydrophobic membrane anchor protein [Alphaproteobacteria bacterium]MDX5464343.1 succinate dehydrogenase, hydrophobic membrane anchor protein [Alphaproteobacteria bacterium]